MSSTSPKINREFPRVLVLGASGRLGQMLRYYWRDHPATWQSRTPRPDFLTLDIATQSTALAEAMSQHDAVLSLAGLTPGKGDLAMNEELAEATIRASANAGRVPVFLCSSAAIYGNRNGVLSEKMPPAPLSAYGEAKLRMELTAIQIAQASAVPVCNLRIGNVAGADAILAGWKPGFQLDELDDRTTPVRSYIGPSRLADVLAALIRHAGHLPDTLNVACPGAVQLGNLLDAAGLPWAGRPPRPETIPRVELDVSRLQKYYRFPDDPNLLQSVVQDWKAWCEIRDKE